MIVGIVMTGHNEDVDVACYPLTRKYMRGKEDLVQNNDVSFANIKFKAPS